MTDPLSRLRRFLSELKRRKVYRMAAFYAAVAFVLIQVADLTFVRLGLPAWTVTFVIVLAAVGFPLTLVTTWSLEITPEGLRRTSAHDAERKNAGASLESSSDSEPQAGERSIAVLPFRSIGRGEPSALGEGMHDALLTRLSNVSGLKVISRTSVRQYRETDKTTAQIARELGVKWVVEGAFQEMDDEIQVNAQLIDPRTDTHRWAASYRRNLTTGGLFDLQSELTKEVTYSLEAELTPGEKNRVERRPTRDLDAYRLYTEGRRKLGRRSFDVEPGRTVEEAAASFQLAIERDGDFALAWAGLADAAVVHQRMLKWTELATDPDTAERIGLTATALKDLPDPEEAARRALELDPELAEAHASIGVLRLEQMDAPSAADALHRSADLKPSYWEAHHWLGELYLKIGQPRRALEHITLAVELNPRHAFARHWLYDAYLAVGEAEKSLQEARRQQGMGLEDRLAIMGEVRALTNLGRTRAARELAEEEIAEVGIETIWGGWAGAYLVQILAAEDEEERAREYLRQLVASAAGPGMIAWAHAGLGDGNEAVRTYREMDPKAWSLIGVTHAIRYPYAVGLNALEDASGYADLLRLMNGAWGLNPDGSLPESVEDRAVYAPEAGTND